MGMFLYPPQVLLLPPLLPTAENVSCRAVLCTICQTSTEIGERCPGGTGTAGAMAFETMSADPVLIAPAQDVVSVAVVLLMVCLKRERRCSNLFTQQVGAVQIESVHGIVRPHTRRESV